MMSMPAPEISYDGVTDRTHEAKWHAAHVLLRRIVCAGSKEFYIMYFTCRVLQMPWATHAMQGLQHPSQNNSRSSCVISLHETGRYT